jgi:hypothetical protein
MPKLIVVVPYRNRKENLKAFLPNITKHLEGFNLDFGIMIVEQTDRKPINRGALHNIGFLENQSYDYFVFHDVDMVPINKDCQYDFPIKPTHIASFVEQFEYKFSADYFGGVCIFNQKDFRLINGYSNHYWGWGGEDNDLNLRVLYKGLSWDRRPGTFRSLPHKRYYWDDTRKISLHPGFGKNRTRLQRMYNGEIDQDKDGLNNLAYKVTYRSQLNDITSFIHIEL